MDVMDPTESGCGVWGREWMIHGALRSLSKHESRDMERAVSMELQE